MTVDDATAGPVKSIGMAQTVQKPLTNADVVSMVNARLSDDIVEVTVQTAPGDFDTSADALVALKGQGVSDRLLETMLRVTIKTQSGQGGPLRSVVRQTRRQALRTVRRPLPVWRRARMDRQRFRHTTVTEGPMERPCFQKGGCPNTPAVSVISIPVDMVI